MKKETVEIKKVIRKPKKEMGESEIISTGVTGLDLILDGGFRWGKIINIVGDSSSGKTYLALEFLAHARKIYGEKLKWFYDDAEGGFSFDTKSMYGFDVMREDQRPSTTVEDMAVNLSREMKDAEDYFIYIVDSLDGLSSDAERKRDIERTKAIEAGKEYSAGTYSMEKQKFMSEFFRLRASEINDKNVIVIIISQVRENIGVMFGEKYRRSGGKALDFYSSIILWLAVTEKLEKKRRKIGVTIKALTKKAKIKTPFRVFFLKLLFDYGIDNVESNINYLYDLYTETGKESTSAKKLKWMDEEITKVDLVQKIEAENLEQDLINQVQEKWNEVEREISSEGRKSKWT